MQTISRRAQRTSTFAQRMYRFYTSLATPRVPRGVQVMNPYADARVRKFVRVFLEKYFADNRERVLVIGINPGRFGAGVTGVTFTDPVALNDFCGIPNHLPRKRELSSVFVYDVIARMGGPDVFYRDFCLTAACPLGFTRGGTNLNYYDDRALERAVTPFIVSSIERHISLGGRRDSAVVLGKGANMKYLSALNEKHEFFERLVALDHPRPIMQYRRKRVQDYITAYQRALLSALR
jgi:Domain of unknown function (DUF4918)